MTTPPSTVRIPVNGVARLALTKAGTVTDANGDGLPDAGDLIGWTLTVSNPGPVTVTDIAIDDPTAGPVTCPRTDLAPGQSMTCSPAPTTATAEQAAAGIVTNTATATGTGAGRPVQTPEASASVLLRTLAYTGVAPVLPLINWSGLAVLIGAVILFAARRRRVS